MKEVGLSKKYAHVLTTTQEIDGSGLVGLTEEKLERWGFPGGPAGALVDAAASLWTCTAIHGVVLAPGDDTKESESDSVGDTAASTATRPTGKILTVRGRDARNNLGGLAQNLQIFD